METVLLGQPERQINPHLINLTNLIAKFRIHKRTFSGGKPCFKTFKEEKNYNLT